MRCARPSPAPENSAEPRWSRIEIACFRVAQEGLTNAARHANARKITVHLRVITEQIELAVHDGGCGFDQEAVRRSAGRSSLELISMKESAALVGGRLEIESASGSATRVRAVFPLRWRDRVV